MNHRFKLVLIVFLFFAIPDTLWATHGGNNTIQEIFYDAPSRGIYYLYDTPYWLEIRRHDLDTAKDTMLKSCNYDDFSMEGCGKKLKAKVPVTSVMLKELDLKTLNLKATIEFQGDMSAPTVAHTLKREILSDMETGDIQTEDIIEYSLYISFPQKITLYQGETGKGDMVIHPCVVFDRTIELRGYAIPDGRGLILIASYIAQCYEFGYIDEEVGFFPEISVPKENPPESLPEQMDGQKGRLVLTALQNELTLFSKLGWEAFRKGSYEDALTYFKKAYDMTKQGNRPFLGALYMVADIHAHLGRLDEAKSSLKELLDRSDAQAKKKYLDKIKKNKVFKGIKDR